ncbi:MAG: ABC transporter substrate-binding protein [Alphaproteobacteria bacterium]|nr:ABC transporter substrate-binding protein [Alphaproteobacteria bacterium]
MRRLDKLLFGAGLALAAAGAATSANAAEIVIGLQCDRTGPTQTVGTFLCPGYHDYVSLVNSKGGIEGHMIKPLEIDHEYKVPAGVEAYARHKKEGAVLIGLYGTPHTQALTQKLTEDKIPGTSPGFGTAAAANGENFPYIFPIAASYWSQASAAIEHARMQLGGDLKGKKIAYIYYDNPAGREPLPVLHKLRDRLGFDLQEFAVPPPGIEMSAQVLDITRRYRADYVLSHLFGRAPSVSMKEFKRAGYPLEKVLGFVWAGGEADIAAAGGFDRVEGYSALQFAGVGSDYPVHDEIRAMYEAQGKDAPEAMASSVYYNRGVFIGAIHLKAIENAIKAKGSGDITGEDVKNGFEMISGFTLGGLVPPLEITGFDHEGGGWVRVFQVKDAKFVPVTEWFQGYRDAVVELLKEDASRQ